DEELAECLALIVPGGIGRAEGKLALLAGLMDGLSRTSRNGRALLARPPASLEQLIRQLDGLLQLANDVAVDDARPALERTLALASLSQARPPLASKRLGALFQPRQPALVQKAAARNLEVIGDPDVVAAALKGWPNYTIGTRQDVLRAVSRSAA